MRRIVEAHGGTVDLESALGEGSTFTMAFPIRDPGSADVEAAGGPAGIGT